jgi:hypothetical protein
VDLIGPYTLKTKDKTQIDFTSATSLFEIVELPVSQLPELGVPWVQMGKQAKTHYSTKTTQL